MSQDSSTYHLFVRTKQGHEVSADLWLFTPDLLSVRTELRNLARDGAVTSWRCSKRPKSRPLISLLQYRVALGAAIHQSNCLCMKPAPSSRRTVRREQTPSSGISGTRFWPQRSGSRSAGCGPSWSEAHSLTGPRRAI